MRCHVPLRRAPLRRVHLRPAGPGGKAGVTVVRRFPLQPPPPGGDTAMCHEMSCFVMIRCAPPVWAGLAEAPRSQSCMSFLHRVSFRLHRRRLACGAALFRAYRMGARARVRVGAVCAPDCARAKRGAHFSRPFRWSFFPPARGGRRSGPRMPLPPVSSYHGFTGVKSLLRLFLIL